MEDELRIVLADDWPERRAKVRQELEAAGFHVIADVGTLRECYEYAMTCPVDAVLSSPMLTAMQEQELLVLLAPVTPLFRPALVSVRDEYPEIVVSSEYWRSTCTTTAADRNAVVDILRRSAAERRKAQLWTVSDRDVNCFLRNLGFRREISGYAAARYALTSLPDRFMAKELYADISAHAKTSPVNVERTLRFAITKAIGIAGERMWNLIAPGEKSNLKALIAMKAALKRFEAPLERS